MSLRFRPFEITLLDKVEQALALERECAVTAIRPMVERDARAETWLVMSCVSTADDEFSQG